MNKVEKMQTIRILDQLLTVMMTDKLAAYFCVALADLDPLDSTDVLPERFRTDRLRFLSASGLKASWLSMGGVCGTAVWSHKDANTSDDLRMLKCLCIIKTLERFKEYKNFISTEPKGRTFKSSHNQCTPILMRMLVTESIFRNPDLIVTRRSRKEDTPLSQKSRI